VLHNYILTYPIYMLYPLYAYPLRRQVVFLICQGQGLTSESIIIAMACLNLFVIWVSLIVLFWQISVSNLESINVKFWQKL
jgi:hypothetical protein